jgi:hypothetical protein
LTTLLAHPEKKNCGKEAEEPDSESFPFPPHLFYFYNTVR